MFVDNLPFNLDRFGLKGIFQRAGIVCDSFIPAKLGRLRKRFGFVRFWSETDVVESIRRFNGINVRGFRIKVCKARYGKGELGGNGNVVSKQDLKLKTRKVWHEKSAPADQLNQKKHKVVATVKGELNEAFLDWLNNSLICVSNEVWDLEDLTRTLVKDGCSKIRALSKFKFVLTYQTSEQKEDALKNHAKLDHWFHEVKNWDIYEVCESRRFWIEVFGVPPHGWSLRNFESIAAIWGKMICLETPIEDTISFESMKILVESNSFQEVMGHIILQIGDAGYRIMVKEANCSFVIKPQFVAPVLSSSVGVLDVNKGNSVPANHEQSQAVRRNSNSNLNLNPDEVQEVGQTRDSLLESINLMDGMVKNHAVCNASMEGVRLAGVPREPSLTAVEAEVIKGQREGKLINSEALSDASSTKTKTAQLSGNGYSVEVEKIYCHGRAIQEEVNHYFDCGNGISSPVPHESELSVPPGFGISVNSVPLSFAGTKVPEVRPRQKVKKLKQSTGQSVKRVTRSQVKQCKKLANRSYDDSDSDKTSESIVKLARESLEVGKLLGVKVIANEDNVIKRITKTLKENRFSRSARDKKSC